MPTTVHDWTRVDDGTFHDFHNSWLVELKKALNRGLLPKNVYAQVEQKFGHKEGDVLTLERPGPPLNGTGHPPGPPSPGSAVAVAVASPKSALHLSAPTARPRRVVVRHASGHRVVALIELGSHGNKDRPSAVTDFADKAANALDAGVHVVVLDVLPAGPHDPSGLPGAVWAAVGGSGYELPAGRRLACAGFVGRPGLEVYADPLALGDPLPETPLFLTPDDYVPLPLAATYREAFESIPDLYREVLDRPAA